MTAPTPPLSDAELAEMRAMLAAATPGPYEAIEHEAVGGNNYITIMAGSWDIAHNRYSARSWDEERANGRLFAAAPESMGKLLGEVERYRGLIITSYEILAPMLDNSANPCGEGCECFLHDLEELPFIAELEASDD